MARLKAWKSLPILVALALVLSLGIVVLPMAGKVQANGTEYYVSTSGNDTANGTSSGTAWRTIQHAIDSVNATATINVAAGTYNPTSTIVINKDNLVLQGPQSNVDPRLSEGSTRTAGSAQEAVIDGGPNNLGMIIAIDADNIVINGLEVKSGTGDMIKQSNAHTGTVVKYCVIHDGNGDEGVQLKQCTGGILEYNYVYDIADPGDALNISDDSTNGKIRYNEVYNIGSENAAIYVYGSTNMEIVGNLVHHVTQNDGIKLGDKNGDDANKTGGLIKDNVVYDTEQDGISVYMSGVTVEGNEVYNSRSENGAIYLAWAINNIDIHGNSVHDNVLNPSAKTHVGGIGIESPVDAASVHINNNNIYNNTPYGVNNDASAVVDATDNWWGSADPTTVAGMVDGLVDFTPLVESGTDTDPAAGFQPDLSSLTVHTLGEQTGTTGRIQEGIDLVTGSTVNVAAGTYNEVVKIGKPLTLLGAQAGVDARIRTGPESIIDPNNPGGGAGYSWVVRVKSSDVTVDGFTVQNPTLEYGSAGLFCVEAPEENPYQNLVFRNNILQNPGIKTSHSTDWGKFGYDIGHCDNVLIEYNYIRDILCDTATPWNGTAGIWPWNMNNLTIRYNKIEHVTTFGIGLSDTNKNVLIFENEVSLGDPGEGAVPSVRTAGIRVGPVENYDVRIEGNSVSDCPGTVEKPGAGIRIQSLQAYDTGSTHAIDNVVTGCPVGIDARNHIENSTTLAGNRINGCDIGIRLIEGAAAPQVDGNTFEDNNPIQVLDEAEVLDIQLVLDTNTFYRAVVVYHPDASLLHTIWSSIQDGINAASSGGTVNVAAGIYTEHIVITTSNLTLVGEDKETTIIDATQDSSWTVAKAGILIGEYPFVDGVHDVTVSGFTIKDAAIDETGGDFGGDKYGVGPGGLCGIQIYNSSNNTIENNILINNYWQIWLVAEWPAAGYTECKNNRIANNIIQNSENDGVYLYSDGGVYVENTEIVNNEISNAYGEVASGVEFWGWPEGGDTPTISGTVINGNNIHDCTYGVRIRDDVSDITGTLVNFNNFADNSNYGVYNGVASTIDATNNWWGTKDGDEIAAMVSDNVDYDPWIGAGVAASKTEGTESGDDTVDATDEADTVVEKSGTGTPIITVVKYKDNPGSGFGGDTGKYIDVHIDSDEDVTQLEIRLYYTDAEVAGLDESSLRLRWWDGDSWELCSDSGVNMAANYMWAKVRDDTRPSLSQLTGTPFAGRGTSAPVEVADVGPELIYLRVDFLGEINKMRLGDNNRLRDTLIALSPDGRLSLEIEEGTLAPVVDRKRIYLIEIREAEECPPLPEDTIVAGKVYDITPSRATFDKDVILILGFNPMELPENTVSVTMAYYVSDEGWVELESEPGGVAELGTMTAAVSHFTPFAILAKLAPPAPPPVPAPPPTLPAAHFVAGGLTIEPSVRGIWEPITFVTRTGESVTITANVANDGGQEGTYTVELKINGETVDSKEVTLGTGQSQQVSFALPGMDYGRYEVEVAGLSGEFTASRIINWWLIIGIIAAIGLITWGVIRGRRRVYS